jgi:hypothetical protein
MQSRHARAVSRFSIRSAAAIAALIGTRAAAGDEDLYPLLPGQPEPSSVADTQRPTDEDANEFVMKAWGIAKDPPDTNMVVDTTITAITIGYPPAGAALGLAKELLGVTGVVPSPDPTGGVLGYLNGRLDRLDNQVSQLRIDLAKVQGNVDAEVEDRKLTELLRRSDEVTKDGHHLSDGLQDRGTLMPLALDLQTEAHRFLPDNGSVDSEMWLWRDTHVFTRQDASGQPLLDPHGRAILYTESRPLDFKALPMLPTYTSTLMLWMVAIERATGGDVALINARFGPELERHARFLSVRPLDWHRTPGEASTLPESVLSRISCSVSATAMHPVGGKCPYVLKCNDLMAHRIGVVYGSGSFSPQDTSPNAYCTTPVSIDARPASPQEQQVMRLNPLYGSDALARSDDFVNTPLLGERGAERRIARDYGLDTMTHLADLLIRLKTTGSVREAAQYHFRDSTLLTSSVLYALKPDGQLLWYNHTLVNDREPQQQPLPEQAAKERMPMSRNQELMAAVRASAAVASSPSPAKKLSPASMASASGQFKPSTFLPAVKAQVTPALKILAGRLVHKLAGPNLVGTGFNGFKQVIPGGLTSIYGLKADGSLVWYGHDGASDGSVRWRKPVAVGTGWNSFTRIFGGGDGILYGIGSDGALRWYRQSWADAAQSQPVWVGPKVVGTGWHQFSQVFSAGQGVIYALLPDGRLLWYRHTGYADGSSAWQGPKEIGHGWQNFREIFSPGRGDVYATTQQGQLLWYRHAGYLTGEASWQGPVVIGGDWGKVAQAFPEIWNTPEVQQVR